MGNILHKCCLLGLEIVVAAKMSSFGEGEDDGGFVPLTTKSHSFFGAGPSLSRKKSFRGDNLDDTQFRPLAKVVDYSTF